MYKNFFGFKERPFQLVPNPAYLFLSKCHEEALAHLSYAVSQGDGFVEITGEVGTGKTTLCRAFLDSLDDETEAAYIFNPRLDSVQLLRAINDEFGIDGGGSTVKELIDALNFFLMERKAEGKRVILLIDEAQNLSRETLEQLRLLSNLETSTSKLIQIILVGQPELADQLDTYDLRQLGQRITLSCRLSPLSFKETRDYIHHRIEVASRKPGIRFTWAAYWAIYQYSGGIPRLINIVCDRALLVGFGLRRRRITGPMAQTAIRELAGRGDRRRYCAPSESKSLWVLGALGLVLAALILFPPGLRREAPDRGARVAAGTAPRPAEAPSPPPPAETEPPAVAIPEEEAAMEEPPAEVAADAAGEEAPDFTETPAPAPGRSLEDYLMNADPRRSRSAALRSAVALWGDEPFLSPALDEIDNPQTFFRMGGRQNGLLVHRLEGDFSLVRKLDIPAVLELYSPLGPSPAYVTLARIDPPRLVLASGEVLLEAEAHELEAYWTGVAYIPWKNFFDLPGVLPRDATPESILSLRMLLQEIGHGDIGISPIYDDRLRRAVEEVQENHGIAVDGVVGPVTKIILYNDLKTVEVPRLTRTS